ncbi:MAG: glycogen debranching enzyme N-terminal domain-containing protein [Desulfamplus sp.]|nr:glycogen debranching enzyme N-terminal domain-containing protein [Desulfamplus sp.]
MQNQKQKIDQKIKIDQTPKPGSSIMMFCGDTITFTLTISEDLDGQAWIRTTLGNGSIVKKEVVDRVDLGEVRCNRGWHDIQMVRLTSDNSNLSADLPANLLQSESLSIFSIALPLIETGHFEAKCFFLEHGKSTPIWAEGNNCTINVDSAGSSSSNIIYNAFVRQFGQTKWAKESEENLDEKIEEKIEKKIEKKIDSSKEWSISWLDSKGYTVIPPSGKFRDVIKEVEFIFKELGCSILQLLPIHPTPTTYGRMGRFGSPYAALNFTEVDPALAEFDPSATPLEQFIELVDAVHFYQGYLILDIAINHTGWASSIHSTNPEWLVRGRDKTIEVPGAWGVKWEDLTRLDYSKKELWQYMADMFILWCRRGVDGFRCDAGYMIPLEAWEYIVARVRLEYPDTTFLLEGLGGSIDATCKRLNLANLNWAYSELFQNYDKNQIENYLPQSVDISNRYGLMVNFAETHDNIRLASISAIYSQLRVSICALFSISGSFGFTAGVEWFAKERIDVHGSPSLNWGADENQIEHIKQLNTILKNHPTFLPQTELKFIHTKPEDQSCGNNYLALMRYNKLQESKLLVVANLDCQNSQIAFWSLKSANIESNLLYNLLTDEPVKIGINGDFCSLNLMAGEVVALSHENLSLNKTSKGSQLNLLSNLVSQRLKAKALQIFVAFKGYSDVAGFDLEKAADELFKEPIKFCRSCNFKSKESCVVIWEFGKDDKRVVMIPPTFFLMVVAKSYFRASIVDDNNITVGYEESLAMQNGEFFALFIPNLSNSNLLNSNKTEPSKYCTLNVKLFKEKKAEESKSSLLYLTNSELSLNRTFTRDEIIKEPSLKLIGFNKKGAMMRALAWWAKLDSKYDALIAANLNPNYPENRWILLSRYRIWAIYQGYSRELTLESLESFTFSYNSTGKWLFKIPTCEGGYFEIEITLQMVSYINQVVMTIYRKKIESDTNLNLDRQNRTFLENKGVEIVVRADIESRSFHETLKAWQGAENQYKNAVKIIDNGFLFNPKDDLLSSSSGKSDQIDQIDQINRSLLVQISDGKFIFEPEWQYMVYNPLEAERGLDPYLDIFSPGYFVATLKSDDSIKIVADCNQSNLINFKNKTLDKELINSNYSFCDAIQNSLDAFIVQREDKKSVIAGYPWFLDWGRDSLIFCRALIEAKRFDEARQILHLFGRFEDNGTLPNMICGDDAENRETSDAPLWFFAACQDLAKKEGDSFLDEVLDNKCSRTFRDVLISMAHSFIKGTYTGVVIDTKTNLLYSPAHFTWMDTNFPACSPRAGYPVEIQALWYYTLVFLHKIDPLDSQKEVWKKMAFDVQKNVIKLFYRQNNGFFSDCLHCNTPQSALDCLPDDALRPNQLFLITLGLLKDCKGDEKEKYDKIAIKTLESCMELLVPGAIRSLADRKLLVHLHSYHKYWGTYQGDEDTSRKPAYHNGTAWTWQFPTFCEAWVEIFGQSGSSSQSAIDTARSWLLSSFELLKKGAAGYIPEVLDGDAPHKPRGCDAQAWGSSELVRVWLKLIEKK